MEKIVLIHGALGNASEMFPIGKWLEERFTVLYYEIPGHGDRRNEIDSFSMETVIRDFSTFLDEVGETFVFGFSLGGYLALSAVAGGENRIKGIVTLGTKTDWSPEEAKKEMANLAIELIQEKSEAFYTYLNELHGDHLEILCSSTASFMRELGDNPVLTKETVKDITIPVRMGRGGKDRMVSKEATLEICSALQNGIYREVPSFPHPVGFLNPKRVAQFIETNVHSFCYQFVQTSEGKLAYMTIGEEKPDEPIVLFLHEGLGSIQQWGDFPEKLCQVLGLSGVVFERRGYGYSDAVHHQRTDRYLHEAALCELPEFIEQVVQKHPLILVGHSDGGSIALLYAAAFPEHVEGVITMAAHVYNEEVTIQGVKEAREAWNNGKLKGLEVFHAEKTEKVFLDWNDTWQTEAFRTWNIEKDIVSRSSYPALIIQGEDDQYGSPEQVRDCVRALGEEAEGVLIPDAGHSPHLDAEGEVLREMSEFTREIRSFEIEE